MAGGYGNFGSKMKLTDPATNERGDLYGTRLDLQLNLYTQDSFNLWVGIGGSWTPEQEFGTYADSYNEPGIYTETLSGKMKLREYALRAMLVPEWKFAKRLHSVCAWALRSNMPKPSSPNHCPSQTLAARIRLAGDLKISTPSCVVSLAFKPHGCLPNTWV